MSDEAEIARQRRLAQRVEMLTAEADRISSETSGRSARVDNKASFLAVGAGIVVAAQSAIDWALPWLAVVPSMLLALVALALAAVALRPQRRAGLSTSALVNLWLDSEQATLAIEVSILREKAQIFDRQEEALRARGRLVSNGFWLFLIGMAALGIEYVVQLSIS